jgi:NAD(P) transhydrogenase
MPLYDVVIIGCGPAGERAAIQAARSGLRAAVIERDHVLGGARVNWGTIPSKTLRESALFVLSLTRKRLEGLHYTLENAISISDFMYRERMVVQQELELLNKTLEHYKIEVFKGHGRFVDPHTVALEGPGGQVRALITGDKILIATGTTPNHPPDVPFDQQTVVDSDSILSLKQMPRTLVVLGAGVIGVEYASIFAALGIDVTLLDTRDTLLPYLDREIASILEKELRHLGITIFHGDSYETIRHLGGPGRSQVSCTTKLGNLLQGDLLLYCVGRDGNTRQMGLEAIGIQTTDRGLIPVNKFFQTDQPHIYAVGDVIGYPALASTSMEQGRQAIRHAFDLPGPRTNSEMLPFAIYAIPEVSHIGETEEALKRREVPYVIGRGRYDRNPRGQIIGDTGGLLKLLFDQRSERLLGVHLVGQHASELIHTGQALLQAGSTATQIAESLFNYPTLSDLYRHAALEALFELQRARRAEDTDSEQKSDSPKRASRDDSALR